MQFIAIFLPSFLGTNIFIKMETNIESVIRYIYTYIIFTILTNLFTMFTVTYVLGVDGVMSDALKSFSFFMIYTVMSSFISVIGAIIGKVLQNNFSKWN